MKEEKKEKKKTLGESIHQLNDESQLKGVYFKGYACNDGSHAQ